MPWFVVRWTEKHSKTVWARDEDSAMMEARDEELPSCVTSEVQDVEYVGPDEDEMDASHAEHEDKM